MRSSETIPNKTARLILGNLYLRYRMNLKAYRRSVREKLSQCVIDKEYGAQLEAWKSLQDAKAILYRGEKNDN